MWCWDILTEQQFDFINLMAKKEWTSKVIIFGSVKQQYKEVNHCIKSEQVIDSYYKLEPHWRL